MRVLVTAPRPSGHIAIVRLPERARFTAVFVDEDSPRDITGLVAELLLTGALDALEQASSGRPEPDQAVEIADVRYHEPVLPGVGREPSTFSWVHVPSANAGDFTIEEIGRHIARGLSVELTSGIAHEAASDVPDSPGDISEHRTA